LTLEPYEEEILVKMYDKGLIRYQYTSIETVARIIGWEEIANNYRVKKGLKKILKRLINKGYVDDHGKSGNVASLTAEGMAYVIGKRKDSSR